MRSPVWLAQLSQDPSGLLEEIEEEGPGRMLGKAVAILGDASDRRLQ